MATFHEVNDQVLIDIVKRAKRRVVFIAPGLFQPVAEALVQRFSELGTLEVTLVLDPDEEVCRIGFGELEALRKVHDQTKRHGFFVRSQPGLRIGVLLADDQTLIWSPTPRAVEPVPDTGGAAHPSESAPNGLWLGANPGEQIAHAVCAEGTETDPRRAEIGTSAVTPEQVATVGAALTSNPPVPVDLARITRVFSTKLQFVELKVKGAKLAQRQISLASDLLNADAAEHLRSVLDARLRAFADFRDHEVSVQIHVNGEAAFDKDGKPLVEPVTEARLNRERLAIEADFLYDVAGFGRLMERTRRQEFEKRISAYKERVLAHAKGVRAEIAASTDNLIVETVKLISQRIAGAANPKDAPKIDRENLIEHLRKVLARIEDEEPSVRWVFKEVTYEQTQDDEFRKKLESALPATVRRRLGSWFEKFVAAKEAQPAPKGR